MSIRASFEGMSDQRGWDGYSPMSWYRRRGYLSALQSVYLTSLHQFSIRFCELIYFETSSGSPTMSFPLYIVPPVPDECGVVFERVGTLGRGLVAVGDRSGEGDMGAVVRRLTAGGRLGEL